MRPAQTITPLILAAAREMYELDPVYIGEAKRHVEFSDLPLNEQFAPIYDLNIRRARAALRAIREPRSFQIYAGVDAFRENVNPYVGVTAAYKAMIDKASGK